MKIALVYDRINKWGGAERVLLALHRIWPDAPVYTAVYDQKRAAWADVFTVHPSVLQKIPFASRMHESLALLTPMAFERFSFDGFDAVISVTSAEAKNIVTKRNTVHICYCLTPTRYLWSGFNRYTDVPGLGIWSGFASVTLRIVAPLLRHWDLLASKRPDYYIAISDRVRDRINAYYHRSVEAVIYPPVDTKKFSAQNINTQKIKKKTYFLTVSRLVTYKRVDILIHAFNRLGLPLVIIGDGRQKEALKKIANGNITFIDRHLTDSDLVRYYEECRAFVFAADEDFGLVAAEAQSCGTPVIAYKESGVAEIVKDNVSGVLFGEQSVESIIEAVQRFQTMHFSDEACRAQVTNLSDEHFEQSMKRIVQKLVAKHKT